jgi:hypothetical protein
LFIQNLEGPPLLRPKHKEDARMKIRTFTCSKLSFSLSVVCVALLSFAPFTARAQEAQPIPTSTSAVSLTLKRAIELALQNSKDIQIAKLHASLANRSALITRAQFMPNLYAGSGAGYTFGIPETPGGRAPALFNVTYTEEVFNEPLRGLGKEQQEQAKSQKILLEDARNSVIVRTASTYLEARRPPGRTGGCAARPDRASRKYSGRNHARGSSRHS